MTDEYELIPMDPIRRVEKRLERLEKSGSGSDTIRELTEIVRANQHVIDDVVKINSDMVKRISDLLNSVDTLTGKLNEFINRIEVASEGTEEKGEAMEKIDERLAKLEKRLNALLLSVLPKTRLRREPVGQTV
jgi:uncharacterized coiled-coil protein SlyX